MIRGLHHVALSVTDFDVSIKFYVDLLGFKIADQVNWPTGTTEIDTVVGLQDSSARHALLKAGNAYVELFQFLTPAGKPAIRGRPVHDVGITHMAFDVTDIDAIHERLSKAGVSFHSNPVTLGGLARTVYGRDPDGNVVEFQQIIDPKAKFHLPAFEGDPAKPL